uniref:Cathepsin propeptide inhibitor domain-containing protein n=1 Tax=Callorhinchus milii TaxID=7868 RepID=A0A4W3GFJ1_CALMI
MLLSVLIISVLVTVSTSEIFDAHAENDWLEEETVRKDIWKLNAKTVANHNMNFKLGKTSFSLSLNALADLRGSGKGTGGWRSRASGLRG